MKTRKWSVVVLCLLLAFTFGAAACGKSDGGETTTPEDTVVASIEMPATYTLKQFEDATLTAVAKNAAGESLTDKTITFAVDQSDILTVSAAGVMSALKAGEAVVTASCEGVSASCSVRVAEATELPQLDIGILTEVPLLVGDSHTLTPRVMFNGAEQQDAAFTFESANPAIATVSENGKITAVALGETDVTVKGTWRSVGASVLSAVVSVRVHDGYAASVQGGDTLYTADLTVGDDVFENTLQLTAEVTQMGNPVETDVTWKSEDTSIATVDANGLVTAVREGETEISFTCLKDGGGSLTSSREKIRVVVPEIELTADEELEEILIDCAAAANDKITFTQDVFPTAEQQLVSIQDVTGANAIDLHYADNKFDANIVTGERVWTFRNNTYAVKRRVTAASKVIKTAADLFGEQGEANGIKNCYIGLQSYVDVTPHDATQESGKKFYEYGGYFVLANDIDIAKDATLSAARYQMPISTAFSNKSANDVLNGWGFNGTFDGRGHTINGFKPHRGGFFGDVAKGASIKNVSFTNVVIDNNNNDAQKNVSALAWAMGGATVQNVFIHVANATKDSSGVIADVMFTGNVFENVIVVSSMENTESAAWVRWIPNFGMQTTDVHVAAIGASGNFVVKDPKNVPVVGASGFAALKLEGISFTEGMPAQKVDVSGFDADLWNTDGILPIMKSAMPYLSDEQFPAIGITELAAGATYTAPDGYTLIVEVADANKDNLTITDTSVAVNETNSTQFTFTLTLKHILTGATSANAVTVTAKAAAADTEVSAQTDYAIQGNTADLTLTHTSIGNVTGVSLRKKGESDWTSLAAADYTASGTTVTIPKTYLSADSFVPADYSVRVTCGNSSVTFTNVTIATRLIATWDEFKAMLGDYDEAVTVKEGSNDRTYYKQSGYYVLTADIIPTSGQYNALPNNVNKHFSSYASQSVQIDAIHKNGYGFKGVFDGRGHTVDRVQLADGCRGIFGDIGVGGTIKNAAFTNVTTASGSSGSFAALTYISVGAVFENIVVHYNFTSSKPVGGLSYLMSTTCALKNVVVYGKVNSAHDQAGLIAGTLNVISKTADETQNKVRLNPVNVYCVYAAGTVTTSAETTPKAMGTDPNKVFNAAITPVEYSATGYAAGTEPDWSKLDSDVFTLPDATNGLFIPVLKSTAAAITAGNVTLNNFVA